MKVKTIAPRPAEYAAWNLRGELLKLVTSVVACRSNHLHSGFRNRHTLHSEWVLV